MSKLKPIERQKVIKMLKSGFNIKETIETLNISNQDLYQTRKTVNSFDKEILEITRKDLTLNEREKVIVLLKSGKNLNEIFKLLNINSSKHYNTLRKNKTYSKQVIKSKRIFELSEQTRFIKKLTKNKGDLKKTFLDTSISRNDFNRWRNKEEDFNMRLLPFKNIKIKVVPNRLVPKELMFTKIEKGVLYNGKEVVGRFCQQCRTIKPIRFFYVNNNDKETKSNPICIDCTSFNTVKRKRERHGVLRKDKIVKKINSNSNTTHRRCTKCGEIKHLKEFDKLYLGIHVCKKCIKNKPNFNPNKNGEYFKGVKVRWFNKYGFVSHKMCGNCKTKKPLEDFTINNHNHLDGRGRYCKECR